MAEKDKWDKWEIVLKPIGGLLAALAIASVGFFGSRYLESQQREETNLRLYAELMSGREKADSDLRKEMFNSIIKAFLEPKSDDPKDFVLALEMLAYNFHDVIDLGPLFKHVDSIVKNLRVKQSSSEEETSKVSKDDLPKQLEVTGISASAEEDLRKQKENLWKRLEKVAMEVTGKQIASLEDVGVVKDGDVDFMDLEETSITLFNEDALQLPSSSSQSAYRIGLELEVNGVDKINKELRIRLFLWYLDENREEIDRSFQVGFFDFPMIDNTRLPKGNRLAIVLTNWEEMSAHVDLVYFPGSRASLKEKPYYDEIIQELVRTHEILDKAR